MIAKREAASPKEVLCHFKNSTRKSAKKPSRDCLQKDRENQRLCEFINALSSRIDPSTLSNQFLDSNSTQREVVLNRLHQLMEEPQIDVIAYNILKKIAARLAKGVETLIEFSQYEKDDNRCTDYAGMRIQNWPIDDSQRTEETEEYSSFEETQESRFDDENLEAFESTALFDRVLRKSQLNFDDVNCDEIFSKIDKYREQRNKRLLEREAANKRKADALAARKLLRDQMKANQASCKRNSKIDCFPELNNIPKWMVEWSSKKKEE